MRECTAIRPKCATACRAFCSPCVNISRKPDWDKFPKCSMETPRIVQEAVSRKPGALRKSCAPVTHPSRDRQSLCENPARAPTPFGRGSANRCERSSPKPSRDHRERPGPILTQTREGAVPQSAQYYLAGTAFEAVCVPTRLAKIRLDGRLHAP